MSVNSHPDDRATARKHPAQRRSRATVERILDSAARIFVERGYRGTTTNHIAADAGVSVGSLYQYFPNKDAMLVALEERHLEQARQALQRAATRWRRTEPTLDAWCASFVDLLVRINDDELHLLLERSAPSPPHLDRLVADVVAATATDLTDHLRRWGCPDPELRARLLVTTALHLVHDFLLHPSRRTAALRAEVTRMLRAYVAAP
jgi:AcrR family transcriptional regulator